MTNTTFTKPIYTVYQLSLGNKLMCSKVYAQMHLS